MTSFSRRVIHLCPQWQQLEEGVVTVPEQEIGKISHYFNKIGVAAIVLTGELVVGDTIHVKGHTSDWTQNVDSMQVEHDSVEKAVPGDSVGIKVEGHAHVNDAVYKVTD
jgi:translation elongation factor EF-1alpha